MSVGFTKVKKKRNRKNKNFLEQFANENFIYCKLEEANKEFKVSKLCFELLKGIDKCLNILNHTFIGEILCYGLGSFSQNKTALHQLSTLIVLQHKYNSKVKLYDPVFSALEIKVLEHLNFEVLPGNEEGKRKISNNEIILVFLPHCPKQLINNFLWTNWSLSLKNCIIIGNSFTNIIQNNSQKELENSANYIFKLQPKTKEIYLENNYHIENIFNDISIHCFDLLDSDCSFFLKTLEQEPIYSDEIELITSKIRNL